MRWGNKICENPCKLPNGSRFQQYQIVKKLGQGSFGTVYQVTAEDTDEVYAMKVESCTEEESSIKMEVAILKTFRNSIWSHPHVCDYVESGMTPKIRYVVMQLCGPNLGSIQKCSPHSRFSESTTVRLAIQGVRSLQSLHRIGFIHRDIKPQNFAIGLGPAQKTLVLLDFGLARQYVDRNGHLRPPRSHVGFRGTLRYCSLNTHLQRDLGRQDDFWSLLYTLIELQRGKLPWQNVRGREKTAEAKRLAVADILLEGMAPEFHAFLNELHSLQFANTPDYDLFCRQLRSILERQMYTEDDPFDWEPGGAAYSRIRKGRMEELRFKAPKKEQKRVVKENVGEEKSRLSIM